MTSTKTYIQYGCGLTAPKEWLNFDSSPTLRLQKMPLLNKFIKHKLNVVFPDNVLYGDIVKGLPVPDDSSDGVFCSHVLEHLSLVDFRLALKNTYKILKKEGIFRCVLPDLEINARSYLQNLDNRLESASIEFMRSTILGMEKRPRRLNEHMANIWGNSNHLWMWDSKSLGKELRDAGFREIRTCKFNDSQDNMFLLVEDKNRFHNAVAIECRK